MSSLNNIIDFAVFHHTNKYDGNPYRFHLDLVYNEAKKNRELLQGYYAQSFKLPENHWDLISNLCYLHDIKEDTDVTNEQLLSIVPEQTIDRITTLSVNESKHIDDYYSKISLDLISTYVKLCDRLANVRYSVKNAAKSDHFLKKYREHYWIMNDYFIVHAEIIPMLEEIKSLLKLQP